jgi:hypothetical protein
MKIESSTNFLRKRYLKLVIIKADDIVKAESMYHEFVGKALF